VYSPIGSKEIIERVEHIRALLRQLRPGNEQERLMHERREHRLKDFITNLRRTEGRAMVQMLDALETECLLTKDGAYRLFGYDLDAIREYDLYLNGGRTHIVESYVFERDLLVELPLELASAGAFTRNALLNTLVTKWQSDVPIRVLDRPGWRHPGSFYVHIGTEDSLGSNLPPGATALVEPISQEEARQPNPRVTYLLQFRNGYRCSRCVVTRGKLHVLATDRSYRGPEVFSYPGGVRIAGRVRAFALNLPLQQGVSPRGIWTYRGSAELILPWEHPSRWQLLATKHRRFVRSAEEQRRVEWLMQTQLTSGLSDRTRRRYRRETSSEPHADALIQMSVEHYARYSDLLRTGGRGLHDSGRFSLESMLGAARISDLLSRRADARLPTPTEIWDARRRELGEYGTLFAKKFPKPSQWGDRVIRVGDEMQVREVDPPIRSGSWLALEDGPARPEVQAERSKQGWTQPLYVLLRDVETLFGRLHREGRDLTLSVDRASRQEQVRLGENEISNLRRVCGVLVPM